MSGADLLPAGAGPAFPQVQSKVRSKSRPRRREPQRIWGKADTGSWIEAWGVVRRLVADDNEGARHQRFVLDLRNGQTVLVAHNVDLAERLPLGIGDRVRFRGVYEWNDLGGLVHWTHHDPLGLEDGGFVKYRTRYYR